MRLQPRRLRIEHADVVDDELALRFFRNPPRPGERELGFGLLLRFLQRRKGGFLAGADEAEPAAPAGEEPAVHVEPEIVGREVDPGQRNQCRLRQLRHPFGAYLALRQERQGPAALQRRVREQRTLEGRAEDRNIEGRLLELARALFGLVLPGSDRVPDRERLVDRVLHVVIALDLLGGGHAFGIERERAVRLRSAAAVVELEENVQLAVGRRPGGHLSRGFFQELDLVKRGGSGDVLRQVGYVRRCCEQYGKEEGHERCSSIQPINGAVSAERAASQSRSFGENRTSFGIFGNEIPTPFRLSRSARG